MNDPTCTESSALLAPVVANTGELDALIQRLSSTQGRVALDTEADSFHHYYEKVCLIQLAVDGQAWLVDPLAPIDVGPLIAHLATRTLLMHGADYDLRLLLRGHSFRAREIFDTMLAAQLLGEKEIGLAALLQQRLGITLDKANQRDDWSERPLTRERIVYAARDVLHLEDLVTSLTRDLEAKGRLEWHREECARLVTSPLAQKEEDPENDWRLKGTNGLSARERVFVRELWLAREKRAQDIDRPPFRIFTNERLLQAARLASDGESDVSRLFPGPRPLPAPVVRLLRDTIEKARAVPKDEWPAPRRGEKVEAEPLLDRMVEKLKKRRDDASKALGLDPGIVAPRAALTAAARALLRDGKLRAEEVAAETGISRWRAAILVDGAPPPR